MSGAEGTTKKEAEQKAARSALDKLLTLRGKARGKRSDRMPDEIAGARPLTATPEPVAPAEAPPSLSPSTKTTQRFPNISNRFWLL